MNFDVFISYSSKDKPSADAACAMLESAGIRCWIAPRDIRPGHDWDESIVRAIDQCRAMVLIFTQNANDSKQVGREVKRAFNREVPVIPMRVENAVPSQTLSFYLDTVHWLDAFTPPLEQHLKQLSGTVKAILDVDRQRVAASSAASANPTDLETPVTDRDASLRAERSNPEALAGLLPASQARGRNDDGTDQPQPERFGLDPKMLAGIAAALVAMAGLIWMLTSHSNSVDERTPAPIANTSRSVTPLSAAEERALKPKDIFKECATCQPMVVVPAGSFTMGSPESEPGRRENEGPQHVVTITKPFAVGKFTVTFDEWDACVADGGCNGYRPEDAGWGRGRQPVIYVSWNDAKAYVAWLSKKTGKPYRLLSEAEWEYAARAGTTTPFWWGASISTSQANYNGNYTYNNGPEGEYRRRTVAVDSFVPNPFGLYDMAGNVLQWVEDCYADRYKDAPRDGAASTSGYCGYRVFRGGSWFSSPQGLRSANRIGYIADYRSDHLGFRIGRTLITP